MIKVLLATTQPAIEHQVRSILDLLTDFAVIGRAASGAQTLKLCREDHPQLILLDTELPDTQSPHLVRMINSHHPSVKVIGFSESQDIHHIREMLKAGAVGYLLTTDSVQELPHALRASLTNRNVFSSQIVGLLLQG